jgi:hypothetical protein
MCIMNFLDNQTIGNVIGVLLAAYLAGGAYRKQKEEDRDNSIKNSLVEDITSMQEKAHYSLLVFDRIVYTQKFMSEKGEEPDREAVRDELLKIGYAINEDIPASVVKIKTKINLFYKDENVVKKAEELLSTLKKWHDPIVSMKFDLKKEVAEQPHLSLDDFDSKVREVVKIIWAEKIKRDS